MRSVSVRRLLYLISFRFSIFTYYNNVLVTYFMLLISRLAHTVSFSRMLFTRGYHSNDLSYCRSRNPFRPTQRGVTQWSVHLSRGRFRNPLEVVFFSIKHFSLTVSRTRTPRRRAFNSKRLCIRNNYCEYTQYCASSESRGRRSSRFLRSRSRSSGNINNSVN